jgi:hypothetical protein
MEPSGSGTNYSAIKVQTQSANITYTLPSAVGAAGTFLTDAAGDGTLSWGAASGSVTPRGGFSSFFEDVGSSGNRYSFDLVGSGAVSNSDGGMLCNTGATDGSQAVLSARLPNDTASAFALWDKDPWFNFAARLTSNTATGSYISFGYLGGSSTYPDTSATLTVKHAGFILDGAVIYASNADGSAQTKTDVSSGLTLNTVNDYAIIMDSGTNIKFYVNGTLVATHTTNLPSGAHSPASRRMFVFGIDNDAGTTQTRLLNVGSATATWNIT